MKVMVIPIVIGALVTVTKGLIKKLEDLEIRRPPKLQHCWDRSEFREESWRLEEAYGYSNFSDEPSANAGVKTLKWVKQ